jgi:hypothetical protein
VLAWRGLAVWDLCQGGERSGGLERRGEEMGLDFVEEKERGNGRKLVG